MVDEWGCVILRNTNLSNLSCKITSVNQDERLIIKFTGIETSSRKSQYHWNINEFTLINITYGTTLLVQIDTSKEYTNTRKNIYLFNLPKLFGYVEVDVFNMKIEVMANLKDFKTLCGGVVDKIL